MPYNPSDNKTLGIVLSPHELQAAFVISKDKQLVVNKLFDLHFHEQEEGNVNQLYIDPEEKTFRSLLERHLAITGLKGSEVLVRRLKMKLTKEKDINDAFTFQAEPLLPYPVDQAVLDKVVVEQQAGTTLLTFLATKKDTVQKHLSQLNERHIDPEVISAEPLAVTAFTSTYTPKTAAQFVVNLGNEKTLCVLLKEGKLLSSHELSTGLNALIADLEKEKGVPVSRQELLESNLFSDESLKDGPKSLLQGVQWNLLAQLKETKFKDPLFLVVTGPGANLKQFAEKLSHELSLPLQPLAFPEGQLISKEEMLNFSIPIGLALTAQPNFLEKIDFRKEGLSYANPWKRFKTPLVLYVALSFLLALSFYLFSLSYLNHEENHLRERYLKTLSMAQKPYEVFEKQYETKNPHEQPPEGILPIQELSAQQIDDRLSFLEKELRSMPDTFPLLPNTPKVSEVLAWLTNTPKTLCETGEECGSFLIDNFSYLLVKRPELSKKNEKYQVKIDLEFTTSSPRLAREFHDALIAPNDFVDPKAEVKWNATKGKYRTSFFLKDKTVYPK